ncbi:hypothetical protein ACFQRL_01330 [Microbacterium fluvii]|uniref:Uncharacterized protein n=1 Tax=Microbacterium fluvii TaxID=415215 RepID=A0ABW2H9S9_9MICO|nr:hypothetical protein [Microbacterium fluvii]MCU4671229.1 hypothetical protein [Microbacterium fluvii]
MTGSEVTPAEGGDVVARERSVPALPAAPPPPPPAPKAAPERPPMADKAAAPVLVKLPPPFTVRLAQFWWVLSITVGIAAIVYLFIIRVMQLPDIAAAVEKVDGSRAEATYETTADIVFWSVFAALVAVALTQIALLVAFSNRRPKVRWWQLFTVMVLTVVLLLGRELVMMGDRGKPLELLLLSQLALSVLALLCSVLPPALRWSARRHDVRRGPVG